MKKLVLATFVSAGLFALHSCKKQHQDLSTGTSDSAAVNAAVKENLTITNGEAEEKHHQPLTTLALSENTYNFGDIKKGESVVHVYEVTNTGKNPLIISQVVPGCGCTAPDYTKEPILPGKKGKITLKFDSSNFDGIIHKQAEVYANVEKSPITLSFTGNVKP